MLSRAGLLGRLWGEACRVSSRIYDRFRRLIAHGFFTTNDPEIIRLPPMLRVRRQGKKQKVFVFEMSGNKPAYIGKPTRIELFLHLFDSEVISAKCPNSYTPVHSSFPMYNEGGKGEFFQLRMQPETMVIGEQYSGWSEIGRVPIAQLRFPKKGKRTIQLRVTALSVENGLNSFQDGKRVLPKSPPEHHEVVKHSFQHLVSKWGYLELDQVSTGLKRIYVGHLSFSWGEEDVRKLFSSYGEVYKVDLINDRATGHSRGYGFVVMDAGNADAAIGALNGQEHGGQVLQIKEVLSRSDGPDSSKTAPDPVDLEKLPSGFKAWRHIAELAIYIAYVDGSFGPSSVAERDVVKSWVNKKLDSIESKGIRSMTKGQFNVEIVTAQKRAKHRGTDVPSLCANLVKCEEKYRFQALDLCFEVVEADGKASTVEFTELNKIYSALGIPWKKYRDKVTKWILKLGEEGVRNINRSVLLDVAYGTQPESERSERLLNETRIWVHFQSDSKFSNLANYMLMIIGRFRDD